MKYLFFDFQFGWCEFLRRYCLVAEETLLLLPLGILYKLREVKCCSWPCLQVIGVPVTGRMVKGATSVILLGTSTATICYLLTKTASPRVRIMPGGMISGAGVLFISNFCHNLERINISRTCCLKNFCVGGGDWKDWLLTSCICHKICKFRNNIQCTGTRVRLGCIPSIRFSKMRWYTAWCNTVLINIYILNWFYINYIYRKLPSSLFSCCWWCCYLARSGITTACQIAGGSSNNPAGPWNIHRNLSCKFRVLETWVNWWCHQDLLRDCLLITDTSSLILVWWLACKHRQVGWQIYWSSG